MLNLYLLNNRIPLDGEHNFAPEFYESPGWNEDMSHDNRGLDFFYDFGIDTQRPLIDSSWSYKESWVKKLVRVI